MSGLQKLRKLANRYKNSWKLFGGVFLLFSGLGIVLGWVNQPVWAGICATLAGLAFQSAFFLVIYARVSEMFLYQTEALVEAVEAINRRETLGE
ncbi:MAG: hypothetical protein ACKOWK_00870 [Micrococcales bacterium]